MAAKDNSNHPKNGTSTRVEPIRRLEDIKAIKGLLANQPRNLLLFTIGINNGLRIGDILKLRVRDVQDLKPGDVLRVKEQKTGKENILLINKTTWRALKQFLVFYRPDSACERPLATSRECNTEWASSCSVSGLITQARL